MSQPNPSLRRHIGKYELTFIAISSVVGSGWLFAALYAAQYAGPAAVLAWVAGGATSMLLALVFAELGTLFPEAGGLARYPMYSHGRLVSFYGSWTAWLAYAASAPIEVMAVIEYMAEFLPWVERSQDGSITLTPAGVALSIALLFVFCVINLIGVQWLTRANNAIVVWKLIVPVVAALALIGTRFDISRFTDASLGGFAPFGAAGIASAISSGGVMLAFLGFRSTLEMAGEVKNPQRAIPFALIVGTTVCIAIYTLLQVAFIGALGASDLSGGWSSITFQVSTGPFAALAIALGITWLATILYTDALVSPSGTALVISAATARVTYAMAQNGFAPKLLMKLNKNGVPAVGLLLNFLVGCAIFLPFPGWQKLAGFLSAALVLSLSLGPLSLLAFRRQVPERERGYCVPCASALATIAFVVSNLVFYWAGWETNRVLLLIVGAGFGLVAIMYLSGDATERRRWDLRGGVWLIPYLGAMTLLSFAGNFGGGAGILPAGWDSVIVALVSLPCLWLGLRHRKAGIEIEGEDG